MPLPESQTGAGNIELKRPSAGEIGAVDTDEVANESTIPGTSLTDALDAVALQSGLLLTAKGDIIVRGAAAPARLAVGTNGQVIVADDTQPLGVRWAADGPASPLTTKGDVLGFAAAPDRIPVGADGQVLAANSAVALGVEWVAMPAPTPPYVAPVTTKGDLFGFGAAEDRVPVGTDGMFLAADSGQALGVRWLYPLTVKGDLMVGSGVFSDRLAVGADGTVLTANALAANGMSWEAAGGYVPPVTTKGDIFIWSAGPDRLPVGTNGQVLTADSTTGAGVKWDNIVVLGYLKTDGSVPMEGALQTDGYPVQFGSYEMYYDPDTSSFVFQDIPIPVLPSVIWGGAEYVALSTMLEVGGVPYDRVMGDPNSLLYAYSDGMGGVSVAQAFISGEPHSLGGYLGFDGTDSLAIVLVTMGGEHGTIVCPTLLAIDVGVFIVGMGGTVDATIPAVYTAPALPGVDDFGPVDEAVIAAAGAALWGGDGAGGARNPAVKVDISARIARVSQVISPDSKLYLGDNTVTTELGALMVFDAIVGQTHATLGEAVTAGAVIIAVKGVADPETADISLPAGASVVGFDGAAITMGEFSLTVSVGAKVSNVIVSGSLEVADMIKMQDDAVLEDVKLVSTCAVPALTPMWAVAADVGGAANAKVNRCSVIFATADENEAGISLPAGTVSNVVIVPSAAYALNLCINALVGENIRATDTMANEAAVTGGRLSNLYGLSVLVVGGAVTNADLWLLKTTSGYVSLQGVVVSDEVTFDAITLADSCAFSGNVVFTANAENSVFSNCSLMGGAMATIAVPALQFANCHIFPSSAAIDISGNEIQFTNCDISKPVTFSGNYSIATGTIFDIAGDVTITGDQVTISGCRVGVTAGGGTSQIDVQASANDAIIVGTRTDAAITDAGTGTAVAANIVY